MLTIIDNQPLPQPNQPVMVVPGHTACIPFTLAASEQIHITITMVSQLEDYSLRAWVSATPGDNPVVYIPEFVSEWHPTKSGSRQIWAYDSNMEQPAVLAPLPLSPGDYFINVENLVNGVNAFTISLT